MERIEIMSQKSILLERHQHEMERELSNFLEENERIRRQLYNRDLEAERAKEEAQRKIDELMAAQRVAVEESTID